MNENENTNQEGMTTPPQPQQDVDTTAMHMPGEETTPTPVAETPVAAPAEEKKSLLGPIIGIVIILLLLIIVGLYVRGAMIREDAMDEQMMEQQDDTRVLDEIEAGLEDLSFDEMNAELEVVDSEVEAQ